MEKFSERISRSVRRQRHPYIASYFVAALLFLTWQAYYLSWSESSSEGLLLKQHIYDTLEEGLQKCAQNKYIHTYSSQPGRINPRFNRQSGQKDSIWIRNATVFDGERVLDGPHDIYFTQGTVTSMIATSENAGLAEKPDRMTVVDAQGKWLTPGLVDMHSHHIIGLAFQSDTTDDANEVNDEFGPITPFMRSLDGLKAYDKVATYIAAGGVTSSLILPGSANIMGGEAFPVKNLLRSGPHGEEVVEELLLQYGVPQRHRQRYMKMACGENPKGVYGHTRMGNAWKLREQMAKGRDMIRKQDDWCFSAAAAKQSGDISSIRELVKPPPSGSPGYPEELKLDSTVAILRGQVNVNIHCYEPEDLEDMLRHSDEFNFPIHAFHHAIEAWRVPEMIKNSGHNITIATFQDFALYKVEAYLASLHAGKILTDAGVPVAYKSDHTGDDLNARYLLSQAAGAHSFGLSEELALQAVTSVPAKSMNQGHRIGYVRPAYDADIVLWDSHPLSIGATPVEVYIDGKPTINNAVFVCSVDQRKNSSAMPQSKKEISSVVKDNVCGSVERSRRLAITGVSKSFINISGISSSTESELKKTIIIDSGKISCFGSAEECVHDASVDTVVSLENGHVLPGLTAVTQEMGLSEIQAEETAGDGRITKNSDVFNAANLVYAKYGIHLEGKGFGRAKIGGVTRAVSPPMSNAFIRGVSTAFRTTGNDSLLDGGILKDDVALHITIGQIAKSDNTPTVSDQIGKLHRIISENKGKETVYGQVVHGKLPLVVHAVSKYDILQLVKLKQEHKDLNLIIAGGHGAPAVAQDLADAGIPVIFTAHRAQDDWWAKKGVSPGPPLSKSPTRLLVEAGVKIAIAQISDFAPLGSSVVHNLLLEASWAAKWAGLTDQEAVDMVSSNVEEILGLEKNLDIVIYEGNPLEHGASVVLTLDLKKGLITECWPTVV